MNIGEKLKRLRQANSLTQEELANRAYLTKGFISQLERDKTSPSIATLKDILDVLGVSLADFFQDQAPARVVYPHSARITTSNSTPDCRVEVLVPDAQNRMMDPVLVTIGGGGGVARPGAPRGRRIWHCSEGNGATEAGQPHL